MEPTADAPSDIATLYEIARALLGSRDARQAASRLVLSGIGTLGARSGAVLLADDRRRLKLVYSAGLDDAPPGEVLPMSEDVRTWLEQAAPFALESAAAARGLGRLRDQLRDEFDAAWGAPILATEGLLGLLLLGPSVLDASDTHVPPQLMASLASLAAQSLRPFTHQPAAAPATVAASVVRAPRTRRPAKNLEGLRRDHPPLERLVGESAALLETAQDLLAVAGHRFPVLIQGESGVGKELAARALHELSDRAEGPFEVVDCGSIPSELIESELFGHVRGSFTGAHRDRRGAFELAHRGTVFLDEIGEMPLQLQTRLLRVLQESRFRRVGDEHLVEVDVRVVAASNRDLRSEVALKRFREDLFYRLNVFSVRVPPLRERLDDLVPLLVHFLRQQGHELGVREWDVRPEALAALGRHRWPGNVRELGNLCAALCVRTRDDGRITLEDLDHVWRRQHAGERAPWSAEPVRAKDGGALGAWVLEQARAARFNLIEAARLLARRRRRGEEVPIAERSALGYYLTAEILRALAEHGGDASAAAAAIAGDEDLAARVLPRVRKVRDAVASAADADALAKRLAKLPAGYDEVLERAFEAVRA
ncbi:MAG: sigma 54-interacting transcriptional regulator [Candidatus Eisenbacteria bacterium]